MKKLRLKTGIYVFCMLLGIILTAAACGASTSCQTMRMTSVHPASAVRPLMGFTEDSVFNVGTAKQLDALPGIGAVLSSRIVEGREIFGSYRIPEDLLLIKGIGPKTLDTILDVLDEPLTELAPAAE